MKTFIYPLWRKQYYFHEKAIKQKELLAMYHPYSVVTRMIYFLWKNIGLVKKASWLDSAKIPFDINILKDIVPDSENYTWVINVGTTGEEQKTTILLKNILSSADLLFIKIGFKTKAREFVKNEIIVLNQLKGNKLCPQIIGSGEKKEYTYLITDAFAASKIKTVDLNDDILTLLFSMAELKSNYLNTELNLIFSFCHGDFCPWNILEVNDQLKVIDWEMAGYQPLGYDLFTYIFQTAFELYPKEKCDDVLLRSRPSIDKFFLQNAITDWYPYLTEFASIKQNFCINDAKLNYQYNYLVQLCKSL